LSAHTWVLSLSLSLSLCSFFPPFLGALFNGVCQGFIIILKDLDPINLSSKGFKKPYWRNPSIPSEGTSRSVPWELPGKAAILTLLLATLGTKKKKRVTYAFLLDPLTLGTKLIPQALYTVVQGATPTHDCWTIN
jgi:hypothetical protein